MISSKYVKLNFNTKIEIALSLFRGPPPQMCSMAKAKNKCQIYYSQIGFSIHK